MMLKPFFWACLLVCMIGVANAYEVNQPLNVQAKLQYDNGVSLVDVTSSACIMSVFFHGNENLIVRDANMIPAGGYHEYSFTPNYTGIYTINVKCDYAGEQATFYEDVDITTQLVEPSGGGVGSQTLNLNAMIQPDKLNYVVNLKGDTRLQFPIKYFAGGVLKNSNEAEWRIVKEDRVLNKGNFVILQTGTYQFDFDFKDYLTGDYKIFLYFDGRNEVVNVKVISISEDLNFVTGWVIDSKGDVSPVKAFLGIFFLILIILAVFFFIRSLRRGGKKRNI